MSRAAYMTLLLAVGVVGARAQSVQSGQVMNAYATSSFLIGNFTAVPFQNTSQYINSTNPVDRAALLGVVPWSVFYNWVVSLERFNSPVVGYVSWQDVTTSVSKSASVLAYQWSRNSAGNPNAPFDCSAHILCSTTTAANIPYQLGAYNTTRGYVGQAQSGYRFIVEAADYTDSKGACQFIARHQDDTVALAKSVYSSMNMAPSSSPAANGRKLQSAAGCAGAVAGAAGSAIGAAAGCIASLGLACGAAVAGGVAGVSAGAASAADACPGCFPGSATVMTPQGPLRMDHLSLGDKVLTSQGYEPVFLFGEQDHHKAARMVSIQTSSKTVEMTHDHFIPTLGAAQKVMFKRAANVQIGDQIWVQGSEGVQELQTVTNIDSTIGLGLFNPYTASGTIIVDDVVASVHSQWFLDDVCDRLGCVAYLPQIYQVAMLPVRAICWFVGLFGGPNAVNAVDNFFKLSYLGHNYPKTFMTGLIAIPAASAWVLSKRILVKG